MSNKIRTTIAVLATVLFLGAMSVAGALTHGHATPVAANSHARPPAVTAAQANAFSDSESMTND